MKKRYYNRKIETMPREDFLKWQWQMLKKQVEYTYKVSGLCQRQFQKARITPDDINNWDDFRHKVPFTTKQDLLEDQELCQPWGTRLGVPEKDIFFTFVTSGTSGKGQEVHTDSKKDFNTHVDRVAILYRWAGFERGDKVALPIPLSMSPAAPSHLEGLHKLGCNVFALGMFDTKEKLRWMHKFQLNGLFTNPAYLETLTTEAEEMGLDPARDFCVRKILTGLGGWPISFVAKTEAKWKAKIYDYYGGTQWATGGTCEKGALVDGKRGFYHMFEHIALHEILNPETLEPVAPGEWGEVVVTPIYREASSFLRFRMKDRVKYFPPDACDCGRPFPLLEAGTVSRYDDMMKIKGINIWPETLDEIVLTKDEFLEYKGRLFISGDGREKAEITVEFKNSVPKEARPKLITSLDHEIRDQTGIGFTIKETTEPLPKAVYKAKRWSDDRVKGLEKKA